MTKTPHLDAAQFARYQARTLEIAELLAVDRHLAECAECRDAMYRRQGVGAQLDELRFDLSEHLAYDQVEACAEGRSTDAAVEAHLSGCARCREEVEDLRQFRKLMSTTPEPVEIQRRKPAWLLWGATAAAVLLAGGLTWWKAQNAGQPTAPVIAQHPTAIEPELTFAQQQEIQRALSTGELNRAAVLDRLITRRGVLLGDGGASEKFQLTAPVGTAVINDRPAFHWHPARGATQYVVSVFDENFQKVAESPAVQSNEWQPAQPLPRGRIYVWQVKATVDGEIVRAPIPPAREARFQVVSANAASEIAAVQKAHPGNHLLLAMMLSECGALDETAEELDALSATDPKTAKALQASLARIRRQ